MQKKGLNIRECGMSTKKPQPGTGFEESNSKKNMSNKKPLILAFIAH